jgi:hypothetical protein
MKTRIIDLSELRCEDEFPAYAAVYSSVTSDPFALSPTAMRWSERIFLSRLDDCHRFWLAQKKKLRCKLVDLFDPLLRHHCGEDYVAVFADHPWQCLLYLQYQLRHQGKGLYLLHSRLDQNIYRTLDWECWFEAQESLAIHLQTINAGGFQEDSFRSRQARMQRFIQRIGVATPHEMSAADANSIMRRFGKWLGRIWQWGFSEASELQGFPWIKLEPQRLPTVKRDLDYPVNQWSYIEVLLRQDFARLCDQFHHSDCVHINRMLWEITLYNDHKVSVELSFRHPYSLHRDQPGFATALYQARYIYDDLIRDLQAREHDLDLPEDMPFLGWRVEVGERVLLAPALWDLFAAESEQIDYQQILNLQNKLPIAFECFQLNASYYPEQSFQRVSIGAAQHEAFDHYPWACSSTGKPLFYFEKPQPIDNPLSSRGRVQKIFLERNSSEWWLSQSALQSIRDYFILKDADGRRSWAYRNQDGDWFKQGEYC